VGVCLEGVSGLPAGAGIARGDVITSINGVPIVRPDLALEAYESARREGMAVIELLRGEQRVILSVLFPEVRRGARGPAGAWP
jgi:S1-C subfamily serine protease